MTTWVSLLPSIEGHSIVSVLFLPKIHNQKLIKTKYQTRTDGGIQYKWSVLFTSVKIVEDKTEEILQVGRDQEDMQPNAIWDLNWILAWKKDCRTLESEHKPKQHQKPSLYNTLVIARMKRIVERRGTKWVNMVKKYILSVIR